MISIHELNVTQNVLRDEDQIDEMVDFVRSGGRFNEVSILDYHKKFGNNGYFDLIEVARFEDGKLFVRNGHHRAVAIHLGGRDTIYDDEYHIVDWKYSDFSDINFKVGWFTPFDVRTHVRIADLADFKRKVKKILADQSFSQFIREAAAENFIRENSKLYCERKEFEGIVALAKRVKRCHMQQCQQYS